MQHVTIFDSTIINDDVVGNLEYHLTDDYGHQLATAAMKKAALEFVPVEQCNCITTEEHVSRRRSGHNHSTDHVYYGNKEYGHS